MSVKESWGDISALTEVPEDRSPQLYKLIIPVPLWCPYCGERHIDETRNGERWDRRAHTTHRCQSCQQDFDVYVSGAPE